MRILVTNDDGIYAPGLQALIRIASSITPDVWVVAPETEQSGASHSLSLRKPLRVREHGPKQFAVDGTPTDCVLLAIKDIMQGNRPDLVLSGVNRGSNLGEDVTYSGTIAAAMEGTLLEVPSIALSQAFSRDKPVKWEVAERHGASLISRLMANAAIPPHTLINVNFPDIAADDVKGIKVMPQGKRKIGDNLYRNDDPEGRPYYWIGTMRNMDKDPSDSDFAAVSAGYIAVTPIYLDLTNYAIIEQFASHISCDFT